MLSQACLKRHLHYDPETGIFTWLIPNSNRVKAGDKTGTLLRNGYVEINCLGMKMYAHRVAFAYMENWVPDLVDHINGNKSDNSWANLRASNRAENLANSKPKPSKTGYRGVQKVNDRYYVRIKVNGKSIRLGGYATLQEAVKVYDDRASLEWGESYQRQL